MKQHYWEQEAGGLICQIDPEPFPLQAQLIPLCGVGWTWMKLKVLGCLHEVYSLVHRNHNFRAPINLPMPSSEERPCIFRSQCRKQGQKPCRDQTRLHLQAF